METVIGKRQIRPFGFCNTEFSIGKHFLYDMDNLKEMDETINDGTVKSMDDLQDIQAKIYNHRKGCFTVPNFFYEIFKDNDEDNAHRAASRE